MRIAIIGNIGSGKSTFLAEARQMGLACLSADEINAQLLADEQYVSQIRAFFPTCVQNGVVSKSALANIVFSDDGARERLNAIAHPRILQRIREDKSDVLVVEMPLLVEIGAEELFDEIILLSTPKELRLKRLEGRGLTKDEAERRERAQASEENMKKVATRIVCNSLGIEALRSAARRVLKQILEEE